jgi:hypothetical protein
MKRDETGRSNARFRDLAAKGEPENPFLRAAWRDMEP